MSPLHGRAGDRSDGPWDGRAVTTRRHLPLRPQRQTQSIFLYLKVRPPPAPPVRLVRERFGAREGTPPGIPTPPTASLTGPSASLLQCPIRYPFARPSTFPAPPPSPGLSGRSQGWPGLSAGPPAPWPTGGFNHAGICARRSYMLVA